MSGFGTTPVSTTTLGTNQFPVGAVAVPGEASGNLTAVRGANEATDSNGNELADVSVAVANANVNGQNTMANSTPVVIASDQTSIPAESWVFNQIKAGKGFITGPNSTLATSTNPNLTVLALSLFNPSLTKNVLIYSIQLFTTENKGAASNLIRLTTTDPGNGSGMTNQLTVTNLKIGGPATAGMTAWTSPNGITASITAPGTAFLQMPSGGTQPSVDELISNGSCIILPAGSNHGIAVTTAVATAGDGFSCMAKWIEY